MDILFAMVGCILLGVHFKSTLLSLGIYCCIASINLSKN
jgi:hypothetical protein